MRYTLLFLSISVLFFSCKKEPSTPTLFEKITPENCGIDFINKVENGEKFNIFSYRNFYNGGGVAIGDINNDGLSDVFLTANMGQNKLYLNKGNFQFEDISESANIGGTKGWSTGVVMVDLNADGLLDIYVCNAGYVKGDDQKNELFINNGDLTFTEKAADFNLDESGYTTHAAFFDYDLDGDLDAYILNNSFIPVNTLNYENKRELRAEDWEIKDFLKGGGDKLLKNENGKFVDVTEDAGIYSSLIGFGLGITVGDVNDDLLPDMYVSNDFFERDYLYINQGDGTFSEEIKDWMSHLSLSSMGADMADINNDGFPEIFATDMLPDDNYRLNTTTLFENYNIYQLKLKRDFYHQYMQNTLQLNNQNQTFSEIAYFSGVAASDWSWGALMFDADNDSYRDLFVCNGVYQDVTDQDFMNFFANDVIQKMATTGKKEDFQKVVAKMPSNPQPNKFFKNNGDLTFEDAGNSYGFAEPTFSNGAAYGDLDNDGDLDLIINNLNQPTFIYKNNSDTITSNNHLTIQLEGEGQNKFAIGSKIFVYKGEEILNFQLIPSRGFQSSVDYKTVFGLGKNSKVDSIVVIWNDKTKTKISTPESNQILKISKANSTTKPIDSYKISKEGNPIFVEAESNFLPHAENEHIDFYQEGLIIKKLSTEGPAAAVGDVDGDGDEDIYIGAASNQVGNLYLQTDAGFELKKSEDFESTKIFEDTASEFFDADNDGDLDLILGSGGNQFKDTPTPYNTRLFFNDGKGNFTPHKRLFKKVSNNTSVILPFDFDGDNDLDLFIGSRSTPQVYGVPPASYLYENDGNGNFKEVSEIHAPMLKKLGMITDAQLIDNQEIIITFEWGAPRIFKIEKDGKWLEKPTNLNDYKGWWYAVEPADLDGDGDQDLVLGNRGENFYFSGTPNAPAKLWVNDFDNNGTVEKIITRSIAGKDMSVSTKTELTSQLVKLKKQNLKHSEFAEKAIQDLFPTDVLKKSIVLEGNYFKSAVAINEGNGQYSMKELPAEVQFSCVCDIACKDLNGDGKKDLIMAGNDSGFTPQFSKSDASFGHVLMNSGSGNFEWLSNKKSGFSVEGDIKFLKKITVGNKPFMIAIANNSQPKLFKLKSN